MSDTIAVRQVDYNDRIEVHLADCGHRVTSRGRPEITYRDETPESLISLHNHCVEEGLQQVVMPCVTRRLGIKRMGRLRL
jgi:hypothetical protein